MAPGVHGNAVENDTECDFQGQVLKQATQGSRWVGLPYHFQVEHYTSNGPYHPRFT